MTTAPNPISPRTPDSANSLFAPPSRATNAASDSRFRDSLDQRVARNEPKPKAEPAGRTDSQRATDDAQEPRTGAQDADREVETAETGATDREPKTTDSRKSDSDTANDAQPEAPADQATVETTQAEAAVGTLEFKPIVAEKGPKPSTQQLTEQSSQTTANSAASFQQADGARTDGKESNSTQNAPALRLAGTDADAQDADDAALADDAPSRAVASDRPSTQNTQQTDANTRAAQDGTGGSLASSTTAQNDTSGDTSQQDSHRRDHAAIKLPTLDAQPVNPGEQALHVEAVTSATAESAKGESPTLRGPALSATSVSDDEAAQNERAIASSVSRGLAAAVQQRGGSLTIRLTPATLGTVKIDLELSQGRVTVDLHASNDIAQDALAKNISLLRSSLESKGLTVDRIAVQLSPGANQASGTNSSSGDQSQGEAQQDHDASDGQSRGSRDESGERDQSQQRFGERFSDAFGLDPADPRAQTLRLRLSAIG